MSVPPRILVLDDDPEIVELVTGVLERNEMRVLGVSSTAEADTALLSFDADLIILDLMMPGEDGLAYCRRLRAKSEVPVIMLTALGDDIDRILGLELGADDYLCKPFNPRELIARIKSVLRRAQQHHRPEEAASKAYRFGAFTLFPDRRVLLVEGGGEVELTAGEFDLLQVLVEAAPRVLSRDQLLDLSRGVDASSYDRSIDSQISRIRNKIEPDPRRPDFIKTVRNLGYVFATPVKRLEL